MNALIPNELGIWIECCNKECKKWRYTLDFDDPLLVPKKWYCHMNSDQSINKCSAPESLKLEKDEIFVESKFKAGCIVWAKLIGHPWSPAMVDFCPEYECYYWFDKANTNIPTQYHVTFLSRRKITRAWVKSKFIKSFAENQDPSFALKLKVCHKTISLLQQTNIIEACRIARAALHLSISRRLKKYNYNSWRLAQRFQNPSADSGQTPLPSSEAAAAGPSGVKKSAALKNRRTKKQQISKSSHKSLEQTAPWSMERVTGATGKESVQRNANEEKTSRQNLAAEDSEASVKTASTNTERANRKEDLDDTRSINSISFKDFPEQLRTNGRLTALSKQVVELRPEDDTALDISVTNKRFSDEEISDIALDELDEIIPNSQQSPSNIRSLSRILRDSNEADNDISKEKQLGKNSSAVIAPEEFQAVLSRISPKILKAKRLSLKVIKSVDEEKSKGFNAASQKSMSESLFSNKNKENDMEESIYRRALSEFKTRDENSFSSTASYKRGKTPARKPLPNWFTNPDENRKIVAKRLDRLSKLAEEQDKRMYQENRMNFIKEMGLVTAGPSREGNRPILKPQNNNIQPQNVFDYLLSSDEDSF